MSNIVRIMDIQWGSWECVFAITLERIFESEELLVGEPRLDRVILSTINANINLNEIAKDFVSDEFQQDVRQRIISLFKES